MDSLLGFVVLLGPLFLIVLFFLAAIAGVFILRKKVTGTKKRLLGGVLIFAVAFVILFGDELIGEMYLEYLCENKTERMVYETVSLPSKYWVDDKDPRFISERGFLEESVLDNKFGWEVKNERFIDGLVTINKRRRLLIDYKRNKVLGESVIFSRSLGWLNKFSPAPYVSKSCVSIWSEKFGPKNYDKINRENEKKFLLKIFVRNK